MNYTRVWLAASSLACLLACKHKEAAPTAPPPPAVHVEAIEVQDRPMPRELPLTGQLVANRQADVAANASGKVIRTFVERGGRVNEGDPLVSLDAKGMGFSEEEAKANLETATAQEELATEQCNRNMELYQRGAISKDEWDRVSNQCRTMKSSAAAARARASFASKNLADATVRAPFGGVVGERYVNVGEYMQPPTRVASVIEWVPIRLQVTLSEADLAYLTPDQQVRFDVGAYPDEQFVGKVLYIGPNVRSSSRDLVFEALVDNKDQRLRPGMFATVHLKLPDAAMPTVPKSAVRHEGGVSTVFAVADGILQQRVVQVGVEREGFLAISQGLKQGEHIASNVTPDLKDGVPVQ